MDGYVDPFAHRLKRAGSNGDPDASPSDEADERDQRQGGNDDAVGPDAIVDDARNGRREAPFADDPAHRVRRRSERG